MIDQTGINSTDSMHEPNNHPDNFPLVYSGSSGQLNVLETGVANKKEQENANLGLNAQSPVQNNKITGNQSSNSSTKKNQFGISSSNSLRSSQNQLGTDKKKIGSKNNLLNKVSNNEILDSYDNIQFSMDQDNIKFNQPDSFALSDVNQGQLQQTNQQYKHHHASSQEFDDSSPGHISEQGEAERTHTEIYVNQEDNSKKNKSSMRSNTHNGTSSNNNISSNNNSKQNITARESSEDNSNFQQQNRYVSKRDPDYGGGSEPLVQRNVSGFNQMRQTAASHNAGNNLQGIPRNQSGMQSGTGQNDMYTPESQKIESDQESSDSHYPGESNSAYSPFKLLQKGNYRELKEHCKKEGILYTSIINEQGNNMIIKAVQNKDREGIYQLIKDAREQLQEQNKTKDQIDAEIAKWINSESKSGYTAAHFSCYIGDPEILRLLKGQGADFMKLNKEESSGLHVASQNDSIASIIFLLLLGIDINIKDQKEATPLHWASFQGLDQSVQFLIAFGSNVNVKDSEGMTPLILSSISGSMKIVRMLLLAGADRNQTDNKERTALYMVTEDQDNLNEDIAEMLKRTNGFQEYWNIRPVFKPTKKNPKQVIYYLVMYIFCQLSLIYFNYSLWDHQAKIAILSTLAVLAVITKFFFFNSWLRNPGYIALNKKKEQQQQDSKFAELEKMCIDSYERKYTLNEKQQAIYAKQPLNEKTRTKLIELFLLLEREQDSSQICAHCCILKPKRSRHCDICKNCVSVYDHHCPWINNCVGTNNHAYFLGYIISIWVSILTFTILNGLYIWQIDYPQQSTLMSSPEYIDPFNLFTYDQHVLFFVLKVVSSSLALFFSLLFGLPLTLLLFVQIGNFRANKTTFERFSQQARHQNTSQIQNDSNRFSTMPPDESHITQSFLNETSNQIRTSTFSNCLQMCHYNKKNQNYRFRNLEDKVGQHSQP